MTKELELVVIGGGPAGLYAGLTAAQAGADVTLLDAYPVPGGQYYRQPPEFLKDRPTRRQIQGNQLREKAIRAGVKIISQSLAWYVDKEKKIYADTPQGQLNIKAKALILATGAYERPVAFPGWTLPGVIMSSGAQTLLYQHVLPGKKVLLAGTGPLQLVVAKKLTDAGAEVVGVLEGNQIITKAFRHLLALWGQWERIEEGSASALTLLMHRVPYRPGWGIVEAHGDDQVTSATIARLDENWRPIPGSHQTIECDTVCIGFGFIPFNSLSRQIGAEQSWDLAMGGIVPLRDKHMQTSIPGIYSAGDGAGIGGIRMSILEGQIAGLAAASSLGHSDQDGNMEELYRKLHQEEKFQKMWMDLFTPGPGAFEMAGAETQICRCEGVTQKKISDTLDQGVNSIMGLKSMTRCGMGECQGRMCEQSVLQYLHQKSQQPVDMSNVYHLRPPVFPMSIESLGQTPIDGE